MKRSNLIHFIKVSLTVYFFYMLLWGTWYALHVIDVADIRSNNAWSGSLVFLPHGARVLMFCFFRYYSLPSLYLADITGPSLLNHQTFDVNFIEGSNIASIGCIIAVVMSVELIKWTNISENKPSLLTQFTAK